MSEIYVVVGTPRSGTSVTAGILHNLGIPMGIGGFMMDNVGDEWNSKGHFADKEFHMFISKYLLGLTRPSLNWIPNESDIANIRNIVDNRSSYPKWGFKGLNSWIAAKVLGDIGYDIRLIMCDRPIEQSAASFKERTFDDFKHDAEAFVIETRASIDLLFNNWNKAKLLINHNDIYDNTENTINSIANFCGQVVTQDAINIVDPNSRRFG